jgi:hypothetical protein
MYSISKRRFVQLAGLSIANRILPSWLCGMAKAEPATTRKLIIVTFGGGVRYSETFSPEGLHNIPRLAALRASGYFYKSCTNLGVLSHFNSTGSIVTGNWQRVDDFGSQPPASATIFEHYRKQASAKPTDSWVIATNRSFAQMGWSEHRDLGAPYGANVVLPKQLLLEAVGEAVKAKTGEGVANRENMLRHLESILSEGYEGIGWTIFKANRDLERSVRESLVKALVEYINGPEAPSSGDELTFFITREIMREFAPSLMLVNFWDMDVAHWGSYSLYLQAITRTDRVTGMLWDEVQANPAYKDKTTVLILPELGRDGDQNASNGFLNHRTGDPSCRNLWLLAAGAGVPVGEAERVVSHVDIAPTAGELLGFRTPEVMGKALKEIF